MKKKLMIAAIITTMSIAFAACSKKTGCPTNFGKVAHKTEYKNV